MHKIYFSRKRNPKHTTEINEGFYIILASMCQCITEDEIFNQIKEFEIVNYLENLKKGFQIISGLSSDLLLFLNEMYIIDEFIDILDYANNKNKMTKEFSANLLRDLKNMAIIIQNEKEENDSFIDDYIASFNKVNELIRNNIFCEENDYYEMIKEFYFKEVKKVSDERYHTKIL